MSQPLTIRQAAELSHRHPKTILSLCKRGILVARKNPEFPTPHGGRWEIEWESFDTVVMAAAGRTYIAPRTRKPAAISS